MIIVTLTSWKKRLDNLITVFNSVLENTMLPDKIVLNLSEEEFPKKENDLPNDLLEYISKNTIIEINWIIGPNTKQWKKIIPTMLKYPDVWTICIDDDRIYEKDFIETLWNKHLQYPNNAITAKVGYYVNGYMQHCGEATIETASFYNNFENINLTEIYQYSSSDTFYTFFLSKYGHECIDCGKRLSKDFNSVDALSKSQKTCSPKEHQKIWDYLSKKYGKIDGEQKTTVRTIAYSMGY